MEGKKPLQLLTPLGRFPMVSLSRPWGLFFLHCEFRSFPAALC